MKKLFVLTDDPSISFFDDGSEIAAFPVIHKGNKFIACCRGRDTQLISDYVRQFDIITFDDITLDTFDPQAIEEFRLKSRDLEVDNLPFMMVKNIKILSLPDDVEIPA